MDKLYWLWLMSLNQIGNSTRRKLLAYFQTPQAIYDAQKADYEAVERLSVKQVAVLTNAKDLTLARKAMRYIEQHGITLVTKDDPCYPSSLKDIDDPPTAFFAKGNLELLDYPLKIGVVGSRKASPSGLAQSARFSKALAEKGITIVSGFAMGIDSAAHSAAMHEIGSTICVLGSGINVCYPKSNKTLYHEVLDAGGLIISEYFLDEAPMAFHFPLRNRIISGLSQGVLVVEAAQKSGALVTAKHALEQGKDVYVIPRDITLIQSVGSNNLLKDGAKVVTDINDILEEFVEIVSEESEPIAEEKPEIKCRQKPSSEKAVEKSKPSKEKSKVKKQTKKPAVIQDENRPEPVMPFDPDEFKIIQCLREGYETIDDLVVRTGFDISKINMLLSFLELKEAVCIKYGRVILL